MLPPSKPLSAVAVYGQVQHSPSSGSRDLGAGGVCPSSVDLVLVEGKGSPGGVGRLLPKSEVGQLVFQPLLLLLLGLNSFLGSVSAPFPFSCSLQAVRGSSPHTHLAPKSQDGCYLFSLGCPLLASPCSLLGPTSNITISSVKQARIQPGIDCLCWGLPQCGHEPSVRAQTSTVLSRNYFCVCISASRPEWCLVLIR